METIRINKYIAQSGYASRREADAIIKRGAVKLNGKKAQLGDRVTEGDVVEVDGNVISSEKPAPIYIAFHKPKGVISTSSKKATKTVFDYFNLEDRLFYVGRLDVGSSGLMLFTNDGDLANDLTNASKNHEKEYVVTVDKKLTHEALVALERGISIQGRETKPTKTKQVSPKKFHIVLTEGRNRQIRRMVEAVEYEVKKLVRVRIVNIKLGNLEEGDWRYLTRQEIKTLLSIVKK